LEEDILFDHRRNEEILEELKIEPFDEKRRRYKSNWLRHVTRKIQIKLVTTCNKEDTNQIGYDM
jgi:hypothetical protein